MIFYLILEIYNIYNQLEIIQRELNVSFYSFLFTYNLLIDLQTPAFTLAINKGIAKLRKYFPKNSILNESKALYLSLILDPRIRREGLEAIGLTNSQASEIYNRLLTNYNR